MLDLIENLNRKLRSKTVRGTLGMFDDEHDLIDAASKLRDSGLKKFDAITPFPVHGLEEAIGIKRSPIPYVTFVFAITGGSLGMLLQYWTSAVDWPIMVGGQPYFSAPAFIPVTFETTILFGALSSVAAMFVLNNLPKIDPPILDPDLTSHRFALWIPENEVGYSPDRAQKMLADVGAKEIRQTEY